MACFNTHSQIGTTPTVIFSVEVEEPKKKMIANINLANWSTSSETMVSLYAVPNGESTSTLSLVHHIGTLPLRVKGSSNGVADVTGKNFGSGYTLMGIADTTNCTVFVSGEKTIDLD
jgi:hypothetical protein